MSKPKNGEPIGTLVTEELSILELGKIITKRQILNSCETKKVLEHFGKANWQILYLPIEKISSQMFEAIRNAFKTQTDSGELNTYLSHQQEIIVYLNVHKFEEKPWKDAGILILMPSPLTEFENLCRDKDELEEWGDIARQWLGYGTNVCFYMHNSYEKAIIEYIHDKALGKIDNDAHDLNINSIRLQMLLEIHLDNTIDWDNLKKFGQRVTDLLSKVNKDVHEFTTHVLDTTAELEVKMKHCEELQSGLNRELADVDAKQKLLILPRLHKAKADFNRYSYQISMFNMKLDRLTDHKAVLAKASKFRDQYWRLLAATQD